MASKKARRLILVAFVLQAAYVGLTFRFGTPPDEITHIRFIEFYVRNSLDPLIVNQTDGFVMGDVSRDPSYMYHYLMSLIYQILPVAAFTKYLVIRAISILFALATLLLSAKLLKKLGASDTAINIGLLLVTNFAQFLMMSSAVNNDALMWLVTISAGYTLYLFYEKKKLHYLIWTAVFVLFGALTKKTFLPLGLFIAFGSVAVLYKHRLEILRIKNFKNLKVVVASVFLVFGLLLFSERIGYNLYKYQQIDPNCDKIHTIEQCRRNGIFSRNESLSEKLPKNPAYVPITEFVSMWYFQSIDSMIDIDTQYWSHYVRPNRAVTLLLVVLSVIAIWQGLVNFFKKKRTNMEIARAFILFGSLYFMLVNLAVNYGLYRKWAELGLALHGRYLFPIIAPLVILLVMYLAQRYSRKQNVLLVLAYLTVIAVLTQSGLSLLLRHDQFTKKPLEPAVIFDKENAVRGTIDPEHD